jgi:hypothetical protein
MLKLNELREFFQLFCLQGRQSGVPDTTISSGGTLASRGADVGDFTADC